MNGKNVYDTLKWFLIVVGLIIAGLLTPFLLVFVVGVCLDLFVLALLCSPVLLLIYLIWRWIRKAKGLEV